MTEHRLRDVHRIPEWFDSDPELLTPEIVYVQCQPVDGGQCPADMVLVGRISVDGTFTPTNNLKIMHPAFVPNHGDTWECLECK